MPVDPATTARDLAVHSTAIDGLLIVDLPVHGDNRGWFKENWQRTKMTSLGLPDFGPVQNNVSFNAARGVTRGFHAEPWDKFVSVLHGRIFGAWVDLRPGAGFGTVVTLEQGPDQAVFVPRGVGNAFQTLADETVYSYLVNDHWSPAAKAAYTFVNLADETLAVQWPIPLEDTERSAADREHPRLSEVTPMAPKRPVIIGANGQLGTALRTLLPDTVALGRDAFDLAAPDLSAIDWSATSVVLNAAAHTGVDAAETADGRAAAWATNVTGLAVLAAAADAARVPLVHISSDYVFAGDAGGAPHPVTEPVAPLGVYGQTKAAGEAVVASHPRHWIVRTSWVVGDGANFVRTMASLADRGISPSVVDDQIGRLTFADDLARGIVHLIDSAAPFGTYHLSSTGTPTSWADLAAEIFAARGREPGDVTPVSTEVYGAGKALAPRPRNSVFDLSSIESTGFSPVDQLEGLHAYLTGLELGGLEQI